MSDVLNEVLTDLRLNCPRDEYLFPAWLDAISQVIAAYPTELRRKACSILVSNDLCVATGVPLIECHKVVWHAVEQRTEVRS